MEGVFGCWIRAPTPLQVMLKSQIKGWSYKSRWSIWQDAAVSVRIRMANDDRWSDAGAAWFNTWGNDSSEMTKRRYRVYGFVVGYQSTNMVRRSLPWFLFLLRHLLRSAPLLRSYRLRLSGIYSLSEKRRLSEPDRVPPLSIKAIRLSKPLIGGSPKK